MENRYCRICWNTAGWRRPTGDAASIETGGSYVAQHGFGHEEWLFKFEWTIDGYRYGFLQPILKHYSRYSGKSCAITLYTYTEENECLLIGEINNVYFLEKQEAKEIFKTTKDNGWLDQMHEDINQVCNMTGINSKFQNLRNLERLPPQNILNVRFKPEDVTIFNRRRRVVGKHSITKARYYQAYRWTKENYPNYESLDKELEHTNHLYPYSEKTRRRAAQKEIEYDPKHVIIQNRLFDLLRNKYGPQRVFREMDYVDLQVHAADGSIFFEIKTDPTAKRCIRNAIGQLLEYSHYPQDEKARKLVIVGEYPPTDEDKFYIAFLRTRYNLNAYYVQFLSGENRLSEEI